MMLKLKVTLIISAVLGIFLCATAAVMFLVILPSFETLEHELIHRRHQRATKAFSRETDTIMATNGDWSHWIDSYRFVRGEYPDFPVDNLGKENIAILELDAMLYYDAAGELYFALTSDESNPDNNESNLELDRSLRANHWLDEKIRMIGSGSGLGTVGGRSAFLSIEPITEGAINAATAGTLVLVRYLDEEIIADFGDLLQINISVIPLGQATLSAEADDAYRELIVAGEDMMTVRSETDQYRTYFIARDPSGEPTWLVVQAAERDVMSHGRGSVYTALIALLAFSLLVLLLLALSIDRYIIKRIRRLAGELVRARHDPLSSITVEQNDEITALEREVSGTLAALTTSLDKSRQAEAAAIKQTAATAVTSRALEEKVSELERFRTLTVDRELKMVELKQRLKADHKNIES